MKDDRYEGGDVIDMTKKVTLERKQVMAISMAAVALFVSFSSSNKLSNDEIKELVWTYKDELIKALLIKLKEIEFKNKMANDLENTKGELH